MSTFYYWGFLPPESPIYTGRKKELDILLNLSKPPLDAYAILFGGQRLGKTSLLYRLKEKLPSHIRFVLINFGPVNGHSREVVYRYLAEELTRKLEMISDPQNVSDGASFRTFLRQIKQLMITVVALEELGGLQEEILSDLAKTLRSIHQERYIASNEAFAYFFFVLTGGIELYRPVSASPVSPLYSISEKIYLSDLSRNESDELLRLGLLQAQLSENEQAILCDVVYEHVHGNPYFTQRLGALILGYPRQRQGSFLADYVRRQAIDMINNDEKFQSMLNLAENENLLEMLKDIAAHPGQIRFYRGNGRIARLEIIGLIREENGACMIRNQLYTQRLEDIFKIRTPLKQGPLPVPIRTPLPPPVQARRLNFILQLALNDEKTFVVRVLESPGGTTSAITSYLPYKPTELKCIHKALQPMVIARHPFNEEQIEILRKRGLWNVEGLIPDVLKHVGKRLYEVLMVGDVGTMFAIAHAKSQELSRTIALQLRFDEKDAELARYPWELLHDGHRRLLTSRTVELTRFISYPEPVVVCPPVSPPLRLLYVRSRPTDQKDLSTDEQMEVQSALRRLETEKVLEVDVLNKPTFETLLDHLENRTIHIIHFDGHGVFARQCPRCGKMNSPHLQHCQNKQNGFICDQNISNISPRGYLAFEHSDRSVHWIDSDILNDLLAGRQIRLAVLSACQSGSVDGETLFNGLAPGLIRARVSAIVSAQLPISPEGAAKFAQGFYRAIARTNSIPASVNLGRLNMVGEGQEWFIPALYSNTGDDELNMFTIAKEFH